MIEFLLFSTGTVILGIGILAATTELLDPIIVAVARMLGREVELRPPSEAISELKFDLLDSSPRNGKRPDAHRSLPKKKIRVITNRQPRLCRICGDLIGGGEEHSHD